MKRGDGSVHRPTQLLLAISELFGVKVTFEDLCALKYFLKRHFEFKLWSSHLTEEAALRYCGLVLWTLPNFLLP